MSAKKSNAVPAAAKEQPEQVEAAVAIELKQPTRALPKGFRRSEMVEVRHTHYCAEGDTFEDCLRPDYWTHVSDRIEPMSHITVINKVHGWEGELRVLQVANKMCKVVELHRTAWESKITGKDTDRMKARYRVESRGSGWRVLDDNGNQMISGLGSETEAHAFIDQLVQSVAA